MDVQYEDWDEINGEFHNCRPNHWGSRNPWNHELAESSKLQQNTL
jgi:hypothetical protein